MKRRHSSEYNFWHLLIGMLLGFFLGSGLVFLKFNRQNDSVVNENLSIQQPDRQIRASGRLLNYKEANRESAKTNNKEVQDDSESFNIITDKLTKVRTIVLDIEPQRLNKSRQALDTIVGKRSNIGSRPENIFHVEYWQSPFNYRGYKKTRNKIVIYGISSINATSFEVHNNDIYMQYLSDYYHLKPTNELTPLVPVSSELLIDQIRFKWQ